MKTLKLFSSTLFTALLLFTSCVGLKVPVNKNKLVSNVEIEFVSKNLKLKQNDIFNLSDNQLLANSSLGGGNGGNWLKKMDVNYILKACKSGTFKNYDILIKSPKYSKPYYGKIAFFNVNGKESETAVARYREIAIDDTYFASATRGRTALMYEYSEHDFGIHGDLRVPTWFILMSDEPF